MLISFLIIGILAPIGGSSGMIHGFFLATALVLGFGYRLLGDGWWGGAALGKRLLRIYVVDATSRQPCSIGQSAIRIGVFALPLVLIIEIVVLACDGRQRWGDSLARTYVLRRHPKIAPPPAPLRPADFAAIRESLKRPHSDR